MKSKLLVLLVAFSLLVTAYPLTVKADAVKVAVYYEAERIDSSEQDNIANAISVVESRFKEKIGYEVDLEIVGSWTSIKDTTEVTPILEDAISKTSGVYTTTYDNYKYEYTWKFSKSGYSAALYIVEQDLTNNGEGLHGAGSAFRHAGIVDYNSHGCWYPFDRLCSIIQHELSHIFGLHFYNSEEDECHEPWCVMNYDYMPYETYIDLIIIKIKLSEQWATDWGPNCRQTLINTYEGATLKWTVTYVQWFGGPCLYVLTWTWTEEYHNWNLTQVRLKEFSAVNYPISVPQTGFLTHPSIIAGRCFIEK